MYHEEILEHYREPQNFGLLPEPDFVRKEVNTTCGDVFTFSLTLDTEGKIDQVGFTGEGCAISTASASLLSEEIKGMTLAEAKALQPELVTELLGTELTPTRLKCALLPLQAVTHIDQSETT